LSKEICFVGHLHQPEIFAETYDGVVDIPASGKRNSKNGSAISLMSAASVNREMGIPGLFCVFDDADPRLNSGGWITM
jgi:hypothetical protein